MLKPLKLSGHSISSGFDINNINIIHFLFISTFLILSHFNNVVLIYKVIYYNFLFIYFFIFIIYYFLTNLVLFINHLLKFYFFQDI